MQISARRFVSVCAYLSFRAFLPPDSNSRIIRPVKLNTAIRSRARAAGRNFASAASAGAHPTRANIFIMSELKVTPMRPRTQSNKRSGGNSSSSSSSSSAGVAERDERDRIDPSELREEHEHRQQEQQKQIEEVDNETLLRMLYQMVLIRRFEEKAAEAYTLGKIGGFCHLYIGQEAVAVGTLSAIRPDDYVLTSYRDHAASLASPRIFLFADRPGLHRADDFLDYPWLDAAGEQHRLLD